MVSGILQRGSGKVFQFSFSVWDEVFEGFPEGFYTVLGGCLMGFGAFHRVLKGFS